MATIRKNSNKKLDAYAKRVEKVTIFSLRNNFDSVDCTEGAIRQHGSIREMLKAEFQDGYRATLRSNDADTCLSLRIHSNLWYDFHLKG